MRHQGGAVALAGDRRGRHRLLDAGEIVRVELDVERADRLTPLGRDFARPYGRP